MAKKKENKKISKHFPYKKMLLAFSILTVALFLVWSFYSLYAKSRYFTVEEIVMTGRESSSSVDYADLERMVMEKNIFKIKLKEIRDYMLDNYCELLDLQLRRAFPNSVIAVITLRKPVAQLYQSLYYPVDDNGVILSGVKDQPDEELPIISGIRTNLSRQIGARTDSKRIRKALLLLEELTSSGILAEHTLIEIDFSNTRNAIFFLEDGLEVKIGREDFALRLGKLKRVLGDPKLKPADIRYIDLRFKEPVIGPRWKR